MSLQLWLPFNNSLKNNGLEEATIIGNNSYGVGGPFSTYSTGAVNITHNITATNFTISFWYNISTGESHSITIPLNNGNKDGTLHFSKMDYSNQTPAHQAIKFHVTEGSTGNSPQFLWVRDTRHPSGVWEMGKWNHFACVSTFDGSKTSYEVFINGESRNQTWSSADYHFSLIPGTISISGTAKIADFKVYDHALPKTQIERESWGLLVHYPLRDDEIETTTNFVLQPEVTNYNFTTAWDNSLHPNAINVSNWSSGYNGGVSNPNTGYHAYWILEDNIPTMKFQHYNNRWLGISSNASTAISAAIGSNNTYTISFDARTDTEGYSCSAGLYYFNTSTATDRSFHDSTKTVYPNETWQRYSLTFTSKTFDTTRGSMIYIYGHNGAVNGTGYVRNVQIEVKDHGTAFVSGQRESAPVISDGSGRCIDANVVGEIFIANDSARNNKCIYITDGRTNYIQSIPFEMPKEQITMSCWIKANETGYNSHHIPMSFLGGNYELSIDGSGHFRNGFNINGSRSVVTTSHDSILDGEWHMITATYDGTTIRRYVDGQELTANATSITGSLSGGTSNLYIGTYNSGGYASKNCHMSDVRVYGTALSATEIKNLYHNSASIDKYNLYGFELIENKGESVYHPGIVTSYLLEEELDNPVNIQYNSIKAQNFYEF